MVTASGLYQPQAEQDRRHAALAGGPGGRALAPAICCPRPPAVLGLGASAACAVRWLVRVAPPDGARALGGGQVSVARAPPHGGRLLLRRRPADLAGRPGRRVGHPRHARTGHGAPAYPRVLATGVAHGGHGCAAAVAAARAAARRQARLAAPLPCPGGTPIPRADAAGRAWRRRIVVSGKLSGRGAFGPVAGGGRPSAQRRRLFPRGGGPGRSRRRPRDRRRARDRFLPGRHPARLGHLGNPAVAGGGRRRGAGGRAGQGFAGWRKHPAAAERLRLADQLADPSQSRPRAGPGSFGWKHVAWRRIRAEGSGSQAP